MTNTSRAIRDGLVVGLIAAVAVAAFYAIFDFLAARGTLYTVDLLGKALFRGLRDPSVLLLPVHPDTGVILLYNIVHLAVSLLVGLIVVGLVGHAEAHPEHARLVSVIIVGGYVVTVIVVSRLTESFRALLPWWSIMVANAAAAACAGWYLLRRRTGLWRRMLMPARTA